MSQAYLDESKAEDAWSLPDLEVFWSDGGEPLERIGDVQTYMAPGWYYWFCFPGCLPDSDPFGPYQSEAAALEAARDERLD